MKKRRNFLKILLGTSTGLVIFLVWFFFWLKQDSIFTTNTEAWKSFILIWMVGFSFVISITGAIIPRYIKSIFQFPFFKEGLKFIIFAVVSGVLFFLLIYLIKGSISPIYIIAFPIFLVYAFFVTYPEEIVFRGILQNILKEQKIKRFWVWTISTVIFALFHWALGRSAVTLIIYIPLGYLLSWVKDRYSPVSGFANVGVHFSYDCVLLLFGAT